ncbi:helix-turn-helix transcriptional regulator [uncultured Veillonella sp.]|uniref:helix-turn-helix transcriptional regulator n=1 Tax=uncultured Veillonella sp. TaxID=159268 RepID=UPI0026296ECD|nr:helix-turn-helix transcriptional regulator [uncultured Veillonella sp.]
MTQEMFVNDGVTLKAARVNAGLTQKKAAKMLGISEFTLINYEKGKSSPDVHTLKKIENLYGVPYHRIIFL